MSHAIRMVAIVCLLFGSTVRLPAPIREEPSPTPKVAAAPKPKSTEPESDHISTSARNFEGTWTGTTSSTGKNNTVFTGKKTLLISHRSAVGVSELTMARPAGGTWSDLPASINASPLQVKITKRSKDLRSDGSILTISWKPPQYSDWSPNEIPSNVRQKIESDITKNYATNSSTTYTLNGDEMTAEFAGSKTIYKRVK